MRPLRALAVGLALLLLAGTALAHVPSFPTENTAPERAVVVPDAVKSWSFYDRLDGDGAKYYRVSLAEGERLQVSTFTPLDTAFTPGIVVMSPSLNGTAGVPEQVTVPEGMGALVVAGERPDGAEYEPFAPSASYRTAGLTRPVETDTEYLIAIYEPTGGSGPVGVALGYTEEFSATEYATVPFDLVRVHLWEGQHPLVAVGPFVLTMVGGLALAWRRRAKAVTTPARLVLLLAGLALVGSGVNTGVQMGIALAATGLTGGAFVTAAFVLVPLVAGAWVAALAGRDEQLSVETRGGLVVAAGVSVMTWAGFLVAPVALLAVALLPEPLGRR